jgi:guanylate kinase
MRWVRPFPVVLSGPSGAGKSTVARALCDAFPGTWLSVSATTRPPRGDEEHGRDYWFLSAEEFEEERNAGGYVEWAEVHGRCYATPRLPLEACLARGELPVLDIDVQGGGQIRRAFPEAVLVFLLPPTLQALRDRLCGRGSETEAEMALRLRNAEAELGHLWDYDYLVLNEMVEETVVEISGILRSEARRVARLPRDLAWSELLHQQRQLFGGR